MVEQEMEQMKRRKLGLGGGKKRMLQKLARVLLVVRRCVNVGHEEPKYF